MNRYKKFQELIGGDPTIPNEIEIPNALICKITLDLFSDPVVNETGITYEKDALLRHIKTKGKVDPTTKQKISGKLFPNFAIK